jgi:hypothetical protein
MAFNARSLMVAGSRSPLLVMVTMAVAMISVIGASRSRPRSSSAPPRTTAVPLLPPMRPYFRPAHLWGVCVLITLTESITPGTTTRLFSRISTIMQPSDTLDLFSDFEFPLTFDLMS